jgi:hypothetical protein
MKKMESRMHSVNNVDLQYSPFSSFARGGHADEAWIRERPDTS